MTEPKIPAPDRDLKNVEPHVEPTSRDAGPISQAIFGTLAVGMGIAVIVLALAAAIFNVSPLPRDLFRADELTACLLAGISGVCLIACGTAIFRNSTWLAVGLLVVAVIVGFFASTLI